MKNILIIITTLSIAYSSGLDNLEFGGYLENRTSIMIAEDEILSDIATIRLEGNWKFGKYGGIETHAILSSPLQPLDPSATFKPGSIMDNIMNEMTYMIVSNELIAGSITQTDSTQNNPLDDPATMEFLESFVKYLPYTTFYPKDKLTLDRALIKLYFKWCDLFIGRQIIAWGTGYGFNPTDVWNQKSPIDPNAPKVGLNAIRMEIPFGSLSGLSLVFAPGIDFDHSSAGFRIKGNLGNFDMSISGMSIMNADREIMSMPRKIMTGLDIAGQIGEVGVWSETAIINPVYPGMGNSDFDSLYVQIDIGADYTFVNGIYLMLEYYHNGLGQKYSKDYSMMDFNNMFTGDMSGFAKHYILFGFTKNIFDRFMFSAFVLENISDQSAMLIPAIDYDFHDNISLKLSAQLGVGDEKTSEYGGIHSSLGFTITGYF